MSGADLLVVYVAAAGWIAMAVAVGILIRGIISIRDQDRRRAAVTREIVAAAVMQPRRCCGRRFGRGVVDDRCPLMPVSAMHACAHRVDHDGHTCACGASAQLSAPELYLPCGAATADIGGCIRVCLEPAGHQPDVHRAGAMTWTRWGVSQ